MKKILNKIVLLFLTLVILCGSGWLMNPYRFAVSGAFSPSDISNLNAWYDAGVGITLNGSDVSQWDDQSGNSNDISQATAANQPLFNSSNSNFNSQPTVDFDGVSEFLMRATYVGGTIAQPNTVFIMYRRISTDSAFELAVDSGTGSSEHEVYSQVNWRIYAGTELGGSTKDANVHVFLCEFNTTSSNLYVDGGTADASGDVGTQSMNGITLGSATGGGQFLEGDIAEAGVYSRVLTTTEKNQLGNYLADKYGTTWTDIT